MKANGEQVDDRIVEVCWDPINEHWRMMRFRDDKPQGNHRSVVENVIQSIADGVEKDTVGAVTALVGDLKLIFFFFLRKNRTLASRSIGHDKKRMESATATWPAHTTATTTATSITQKQWAAATAAVLSFSCSCPCSCP